ncbi:DUF58 domain-containing protein [Chloroflexota bacterium]
MTEYFMFFAIALLLGPHVGPLFSLLISLPVLLLITRGLEKAAQSFTYQDIGQVRHPTNLCLTILIIVIVVLSVSLMFSNLSLLLACTAMIIYLGIMGLVIMRKLPLKPVEETIVPHRMVAGTQAHLRVKLTINTKLGGLLFLESPHKWLKVSPNVLSLMQDNTAVMVTMSPDLSGPSIVKLNGQATDRFGLIRIKFELEPIRLFVIPRARYAAWLANKYMAETKPGDLPLISTTRALESISGLRRGVEYYGSQLYHPGDSLRNIDWKHSLKYNELISKEFAEFHGQSAILLINLSAENAEEADKLGYKIIVTAISLAQESIPAAVAVYDHEDVKITTGTLQTYQLLRQCLQVAKEIVTFTNPLRYLNPPDVSRLRANISRLRLVEREGASTLVELLELEYKNLKNNAKLNPATKALSEVFTKVDRRSNIVILSQRNHDAEAIAFNAFSFIRQGNTVITI